MNYADWNKKLIDWFFPEGPAPQGNDVHFNLVDGYVLKIIAPDFPTTAAAAADFICACADEFTNNGQINVYAGITKVLEEQQPPEYGIALFCFFSLVWQYEIDEGRADQYYPRVKECICWAKEEINGQPPDDADFCTGGNEAYKGMNKIRCLLDRISEWAANKGFKVPVERAGSDEHIGYPRYHAEKIWGEIAEIYEKFACGCVVESAEKKYRDAWEESGFGCFLEWTIYNGLKLKPSYPFFLACEYLKDGTWKTVTYDTVPEDSEAVRFRCKQGEVVKEIKKKDFPPKVVIGERSFLYSRNGKWHFCEEGQTVNVRKLVITGSPGNVVSVRSNNGNEQNPPRVFSCHTYAEYDLRGLIGSGGDLLIDGQKTGLTIGFDPTIIVSGIRYSDLKCRGCEVLELESDPPQKIHFHYSGKQSVAWQIGQNRSDKNSFEFEFDLSANDCNHRLTVHAGKVHRTFVFVQKETLPKEPLDDDCVKRGILKYSCGRPKDGEEELVLEKRADKVLWGWRADRHGQIEDINQQKSFTRENLTGELVYWIPEGMEPLMCGELSVPGNPLDLSCLGGRWGKLQLHCKDEILADLDLIPTAPCFCKTGQGFRLFFPKDTDCAAFSILKVTDNLQAKAPMDCFCLIPLKENELEADGNDSSWRLCHLPEEALYITKETEPSHQGGVRLFLCEGSDKYQIIMSAMQMNWTPDADCTPTLEVCKPGEQFDFLAMRGKLSSWGITSSTFFAPIFAKQYSAYDVLKKRFETENLLLQRQTVVQGKPGVYSAEQVQKMLDNASPMIQLDDSIPEEIRNYFTSLPNILKKNITRAKIPGLGELFPKTDDNANFNLRGSMKFVIRNQEYPLRCDPTGVCLFQFEGGTLCNDQDELQIQFSGNRNWNHHLDCHLEIIDEDEFKKHLVDDCDVDTDIPRILDDDAEKKIVCYAEDRLIDNNRVFRLIREAFRKQPTNKKMIVFTAIICCSIVHCGQQPVYEVMSADDCLRKTVAAFLFHNNEKVRKLFVSELLGAEFFLTWIKETRP